VNGCTDYVDMTANGATINGPMDPNPAQFSPNCVHVKVGQTVTWNVLLSSHPLAASGGDSPSPITTTASGTSVTFTFSNAGAFGYHCLAHPTIMFGAVYVTP
jgi:plastocyanin